MPQRTTAPTLPWRSTTPAPPTCPTWTPGRGRCATSTPGMRSSRPSMTAGAPGGDHRGRLPSPVHHRVATPARSCSKAAASTWPTRTHLGAAAPGHQGHRHLAPTRPSPGTAPALPGSYGFFAGLQQAPAPCCSPPTPSTRRPTPAHLRRDLPPAESIRRSTSAGGLPTSLPGGSRAATEASQRVNHLPVPPASSIYKSSVRWRSVAASRRSPLMSGMM